MAVVRMSITNYAVLEPNILHGSESGVGESLYPLASTFTASAPAEQGMLLSRDHANSQITLPSALTSGVMMHYSERKQYDDRQPQLRKFALAAGEEYPRLVELTPTDIYRTNCIAYNNSEFTNDAVAWAAIAASPSTALYVTPCSNGGQYITADASTTNGNIIGIVEGKVTLPDGNYGMKVRVVRRSAGIL